MPGGAGSEAAAAVRWRRSAAESRLEPVQIPMPHDTTRVCLESCSQCWPAWFPEIGLVSSPSAYACPPGNVPREEALRGSTWPCRFGYPSAARLVYGGAPLTRPGLLHSWSGICGASWLAGCWVDGTSHRRTGEKVRKWVHCWGLATRAGRGLRLLPSGPSTEWELASAEPASALCWQPATSSE